MAKDTLTEVGEDELVNRLSEEKERLFKLRFQLATGQHPRNIRFTAP